LCKDSGSPRGRLPEIIRIEGIDDRDIRPHTVFENVIGSIDEFKKEERRI